MNPVDVDVEDVLADVANVLVERETGRSQSYHSEVREIEDIIYLMPGAWESIMNSLTALDQSMAPLGSGPAAGEGAVPETGGPLGSVKGLLKRFVQKSIYWYVHPIVVQLHSMHASMTRALHEMADQVKSVSDRLDVMEKETLGARVKAIEGERFEERIGRLERAWRLRESEVQSPPAMAAATAAAVAAGPTDVVPAERQARRSEPLFHFDYYWFESIHRGDRALIKRRQQPYLEFFEGCENVLDVGCGRGEFLELLEEKGIGGYGIDIEADSVQFCADSGLRAVKAEALEHLAGLGTDVLDGVFISQVAEHMTPDELIELVGLAYARIKQGGFIVVETPNPQCLLIFASFFYADLSHVQPIHPETMRFLLLSAGFKDVEIKLTNPVPRNQRLAKVVVQDVPQGETWVNELNANVDKLNSVLFSYMDYAAIARK